MSKQNVILFGSDYMAEEYLKVLRAFGCRVSVIGRNQEKAVKLAEKYGATGFGGGVEALKNFSPKAADLVIIASAVESLKEVSCACLEKGYKNILVEKPGALNLFEFQEIKKKINADVIFRIAYNRRFYNSVLILKEKISADGGPVAAFFDFTDREKDIFSSPKSPQVLKRWGLANSTHVIDTAFYLVGLPVELTVMRDGTWERHPSGNVFVGCGKTSECLFSYFSTWAGGGRWNIEISTKTGRYKLSPLEELQFCKKDQFSWVNIDMPDNDDQRHKPGLYKMVKSILIDKDYSNLPDIDQQIDLAKSVNRIFNYED